MPRFFPLISFLFFSLPARAQSGQDMLHYRFEIRVSDASDTVYGRAVVTAKPGPGALQLVLQLASINPRGRGMKVKAVSSGGQSLSFIHRNDSVLIDLVNPGDAASPLSFELVYQGIPADGLIISRNLHGDRSYFSDNWPDRAHQWIPCVDRPDDKASFEFVVTAPVVNRVISNGVLLSAGPADSGYYRTHWQEKIPLSTKIMAIGIARFAVKEYGDSPAGIPVSAWSYPQDSSLVFRNFAPASAILRFFSGYVGPFPFAKLANVQSRTIFGGMENAGAIFYDESTSASSQSIESLLAHEIAHQWFGDMASEKKFAHLWLSEGFATYLTHLYSEFRYGPDSLRSEMKADRYSVIEFSRSGKRPVVDSVSSFRRLLNANSYQKGSWILHMLRRQLGDSVFRRIIRRYYAGYAGGNADTRDFQQICQQESGSDLSWFFDQWLFRAGQPKLSISWKYEAARKRIRVQISQGQDSLFRFPLDIEVRAAGGKRIRQTLQVSRPVQVFYLATRFRPLQLVADPGVSLLFEGQAEKWQ